MNNPYVSQSADLAALVVPTEAEISDLHPLDGIDGKPDETTLRVIEVNPEADSRWDSFVASHEEGLVYHSSSYLQVLSQEYSSEPVFLACEDPGGELRGILPLFHTRGIPFHKGELFGPRLTSLPRTPVAGPLALDAQATIALLRAAKEKTLVRKGTMLQVKVQKPLEDDLLEGLVCIPWRMTYVLELPDRPEMLRFGNSRNHTRIKQRVARSARLGVVVRDAETERDLKSWYDLYLETMRWHAVPPRPYRLFKGFWDRLRPHQMRLLLAEQDTGKGTKVLAGSIFLRGGKTVFYAFNGRRGDDLSMQPNYAILWKAIVDACKDGFRYFDLGEVTEENAGLAEFKGKWAGKPKLLQRYYYPVPRESVSRKTESNGLVGPVVEAMWRRLPLRLTALLGNLVYRFL